MSSAIRRLPDGELEVMQALWDCTPPVFRSDLEEILQKRRPMAITTLLTMLTRLGEKGFLTIEKRGRRSIYTPAVSREDYQAAQSRSFFEKVCGGSLPAFAAALSGGGLTKEELRQLRELLERDAL